MNKFQLGLLHDLLELISPPAAGDIFISIAKGPNEAVVEAKLISRQLSFWIYEDGASILGDGIDVRFEAESYRESSVLARAFLKKANEIVLP